MIIEIRYTVKYHPGPVKKVANVLFVFGVGLLLISHVLWIPFSSLPPDLQAFAILHIVNNLMFDLNNVSFLILGVGFMLWLFRWRSGKIELTNEKLIIKGSYDASLWLRNMYEVDIRDMEMAFHRWRIRLDSKTEALHLKFLTEEEFEEFSEKLVKAVGRFDNVKIKITT